MSLAGEPTHFDATAYLAWEADQPGKHEYLDGEVFAMAGASDAHVTIALNMAMALRNHLRGGPCNVLISDMKLRVEADNAFFSTPTSSSPAPPLTGCRASTSAAPPWSPRCSRPPPASMTAAPSSAATASCSSCANTS